MRKLKQLQQDLKQAYSNKRKAASNVKNMEKELKSSYQKKLRTSRQLSDSAQPAMDNSYYGEASLSELQGLEHQISEADRQIRQDQKLFENAKAELKKAKSVYQEAEYNYLSAYYDFAVDKWKELEETVKKAESINDELLEFGGLAWKYAHQHPVIAKSFKTSDATIGFSSNLISGTSSLKALKKRIKQIKAA